MRQTTIPKDEYRQQDYGYRGHLEDQCIISSCREFLPDPGIEYDLLFPRANPGYGLI